MEGGEMEKLQELPELLTPREAARALRTTTNTLAQNRYLGRGVAFFKSGRRIFYSKSDILAALAASRVDPQAVARD
jgi:hypothetical protein